MTATELLVMFVLLVPVGIVAGFAAGLLGVGGGIVIVPTLFWLAPVLGLPEDTAQHIAVATSLATIIPTGIASARAHRRLGSVDQVLLRTWLPGVFIGSVVGASVGGFLDTDVLVLVFGVVALLVSILLALPRSPILLSQPPRSRPLNVMLAIVVGGISALMGIGGGTLAVPLLTMFSVAMHTAVGTGAALGATIAVPGTLAYIITGLLIGEDLPPLGLGYVHVPFAIVLALATTFVAPWGAKVAHRLDRLTLRRCFSGFLLVTAIRMLWP
jgi:uncharacterized protein